MPGYSLPLPFKWILASLLSSWSNVFSLMFYEQSIYSRPPAGGFEEVQVVKANFHDANWMNHAERFSCSQYWYHSTFDISQRFNSTMHDIAVIRLDRHVDSNIMGLEMLSMRPLFFRNFNSGLLIGMGASTAIPNLSFPRILRGKDIKRKHLRPCNNLSL